MKLGSLLQILMVFHSKKNTPTVPLCKDCAFYKPFPISDPFNRQGECRKFVERDIITGSLIYENAFLCRNDHSKCGPKGEHFLPNDNKIAIWLQPNQELGSEYDYEDICDDKTKEF